jgi:hypothetical protein
MVSIMFTTLAFWVNAMRLELAAVKRSPLELTPLWVKAAAIHYRHGFGCGSVTV